MTTVVRIIYERYIGTDQKKLIGGIESYIDSLCRVCKSMGFKPYVYYYAEESLVLEYNDYKTIGVKRAKTAHDLIKYIDLHDDPNYEDDILIFATDFMIVKNNYKHTIAIQHGVAWDITKHSDVGDIFNIIQIVKGALRSIKKYFRFKKCNNIVCVDYNFVNWYRTQVLHVGMDITVIPNYTQIYDDLKKSTVNEDAISVVFARRFVQYRGTRLFADAICEVVKIHPDVRFVLAGEGPDEEWLHHKLDEYDNVSFTKFRSEESIRFHTNFDIAVVPTEGSEGTSLSLLEAMSAGCAVIATNVGGITNIIINRYNGLIIKPDVNALVNALLELIENAEERKELAQKGKETVRKAFSITRWEQEWKSVLERISCN